MDETDDDLAELQRVIDDSYANATGHLLQVHEPERRMTAAAVAAELTGMRLLVLATSTRDGRPVTGPVDGIFYRALWHFGSAPDSIRFRHIQIGRAHV